MSDAPVTIWSLDPAGPVVVAGVGVEPGGSIEVPAEDAPGMVAGGLWTDDATKAAAWRAGRAAPVPPEPAAPLPPKAPTPLAQAQADVAAAAAELAAAQVAQPNPSPAPAGDTKEPPA